MRTIATLIALIALVSLAHGQEIPQGKQDSAPVPVVAQTRHAKLVIDRSPLFNNPNVALRATVEMSFDGGVTFPHRCVLFTPGGRVPNDLSTLDCPTPRGRVVTHVKTSTEGIGGPVAVTRAPSMEIR
jgi:hypothetical protein